MGDNSALIKKLRLDKFDRKLIQHRPEDLPELEGVPFDTAASGTYQLVLTFVFSLDEMARAIYDTADAGLLADGGYLYLAYPKKGNKRFKEYIERDSIFPRLGVDEDSGFVGDTKLKFSLMVAFNDVFTVVGLKRVENPSAVKKCAGSSVGDFVERIPDLREALSRRPDILSLYDSLTYGYQKDWARYVYSAKTGATREKRLLDMEEILTMGYKTIALYRKAQN